MERYKQIIKIEKIRELLKTQNIDEAISLADTLNMQKIKNTTDLCMVAEAYQTARIYEKSKQYFQQAYDKNPTRRILLQLVKLAIKMRYPREAEGYLDEYEKQAPNDYIIYIYRYNIAKLKNKPIAELIVILKKLCSAEYIDKWAYELVKLYHKAGMKDECIRECNEIILWFGYGEYVDRAKALVAYYNGELSVEDLRNRTEYTENKENTGNQQGNTEDNAEDDARAQKEEERRKQNEERLRIEQERETQRRRRAEEDDRIFNEAFNKVIQETLNDEAGEKASEKAPETPNDTEQEATEEVQEVTAEKKQEETESTQEVPVEKKQEEAENIQEVTTEKKQKEAENIQEVPTEKKQEEAENIQEIATEKKQEEAENTQEIAAEKKQKEAENIQEIATEKKQKEAENIQEVTTEKKQEEAENIQEVTAEKKQKEAENTQEVKTEEKQKEIENIQKVTDDEKPETPIEDQQFKTTGAFNDLESLLISPQISADSRLQKVLDQNNTTLEATIGRYVDFESIGAQLIRSLEILLNIKASGLGAVISGSEACGKTTLAKGIAKLLHMAGRTKNKGILVIDSDKINGMNITEKLDKLRGYCILIQKAGKISSATADVLVSLQEEICSDTVILLEDERGNLTRLFRTNMSLNKAFSNRINMPGISCETLYRIAARYLYSKEYTLDSEAAQRLEILIAGYYKDNAVTALSQVGNLIKTITANAERRYTKGLSDIVSAGKLSEYNMSLITLEDIPD